MVLAWGARGLQPSSLLLKEPYLEGTGPRLPWPRNHYRVPLTVYRRAALRAPAHRALGQGEEHGQDKLAVSRRRRPRGELQGKAEQTAIRATGSAEKPQEEGRHTAPRSHQHTQDHDRMDGHAHRPGPLCSTGLRGSPWCPARSLYSGRKLANSRASSRRPCRKGLTSLGRPHAALLTLGPRFSGTRPGRGPAMVPTSSATQSRCLETTYGEGVVAALGKSGYSGIDSKKCSMLA